ncbi:SDR family NAD(P)-dependent oxidoreductase, partial [Rhizobium ruizarguesonis]
ISPADWRRCVEIVLTGQFLCTHYAVPKIKTAGVGSIVNMSSAACLHGYAYRTPYSAAKFGVIVFTHSLAKELGPHNIRVNANLSRPIPDHAFHPRSRDDAGQN